MSSDKARVSYDPTRQYRGVVAQQGRVTLEADWNEAQMIAGEGLRQETLDIVGPSGTPDDGYRVLEEGLPNYPFDFRVQQGTMYVGGERVFLPAPVQYGQQEEWLDHTGDPLWVDPPSVRDRDIKRELVYLLLREQEVSAVEDPALKDVALGGPDSAQRTRLIQRIVRLGTEAQDCQGALEAAGEAWEGLDFDPATMRLESAGRLKVDFVDTDTGPDLCEPEARGGYLGADNQLIRVQVSGIEEDGRPRILWGFDNASFLYRVVVDPPGGQTLRLLSRPVDDYHMPRAGQAVEVLRSAVSLTDQDYIASATGAVFTLDSAYDPGTQTISLPNSLPDEYHDDDETPMLFLRVWEGEEVVTPGRPIELSTEKQRTGLQVTLQARNDLFHVGDYWEIAVRPGTPTEAYPQRYLDDFQPPDGPRLWACPLAVIEWEDRILLKVLEDCRNPFDNLVELTRRKTGCCDVTVRPEDLHEGRTLQNIIDGLFEGERDTEEERDAERERDTERRRARICLMPGVYDLPAPLRLGQEHSRLTIEGCHDGAVLRAAPGREDRFSRGLIMLDRADGVTLRGLRFRLPDPPDRRDDRAMFRPLQSTRQVWFASIGILAFHCAELTVENCLFRYSIARQVNLIAAGILAMSECWTHTVRGNRFLHGEFDMVPEEGEPYRILIGYLLASSLRLPGRETDDEAASGTMVPALLEDATFRDNRFANLTLPIWISADVGGVTIEDNTVHGCYAGFSLTQPGSQWSAQVLNQVMVASAASNTASRIRNAIFGSVLDRILLRTGVLARLIPLDPAFDTSHAIEVPASEASVDAGEHAAHLQEFFDRLLTQIDSSFQREADGSAVSLGEAGGLEGEQEDFHEAYLRLATLERAALAATEEGRGRMRLALHVTDNELDLLLPEEQASLFGLWVERAGDDPESLVTVTANTVRTRSDLFPTAVLLLAQYCAVTGSVFLNEARRRPGSLIVVPGRFGDEIAGQSRLATVAITGNVCRGDLTAPQRNLPVPLNTWDALNTVFL